MFWYQKLINIYTIYASFKSEYSITWGNHLLATSFISEAFWSAYQIKQVTLLVISLRSMLKIGNF